MTTATTALPARPDVRLDDRRRARGVELLVVGGVTLLAYPLAWLLRASLGLDAADYAVGFAAFYGAYVVNDPHFAVTYLLFYRDARRRTLDPAIPLAQRVRYVVAGAVVPAALVAWGIAAFALRSSQALGAMIQLMYLLVGWHYAKQGFGALAVLSMRRGMAIAPRVRSAALAHAYAGWAFAWASPATAGGEFEERGVVYSALAHPRWLEIVAGAALAASTIALAVAVTGAWRRDRRSVPVGPLGVFLITVWSWTIFSSLDPLVQYVIPALHSIQYLYFVWLLRRNEARAPEGAAAFGPSPAVRVAQIAIGALVLGVVLFHGAPALLDAALVPRPRHGMMPIGWETMGPTPFVATFYVVVNVHHYFMDHVIWRRENPETRFLRDPITAPRS